MRRCAILYHSHLLPDLMLLSLINSRIPYVDLQKRRRSAGVNGVGRARQGTEYFVRVVGWEWVRGATGCYGAR